MPFFSINVHCSQLFLRWGSDLCAPPCAHTVWGWDSWMHCRINWRASPGKSGTVVSATGTKLRVAYKHRSADIMSSHWSHLTPLQVVWHAHACEHDSHLWSYRLLWRVFFQNSKFKISVSICFNCLGDDCNTFSCETPAVFHWLKNFIGPSISIRASR